MQAVIMAAGKSTRTYPLTLTRPKPLLKIANKTILEHNLEQLSGITEEVIIIIGYKKDMILEFFRRKKPDNMKITFVEQKEQLGTGHALLQAEAMIKNRFITLMGDDLYDRKDIDACIKHDYCILAKKVENPQNFSVLETQDSKLKDIAEKPENPKTNMANTGCYVFDKKIFPFLKNLKKSRRNEYEITDALKAFACQTDIIIEEAKGLWQPLAYPWNMLDANKALLSRLEAKNLGTIEKNVTIKGNVAIGENTIIRSGSYIEGPVIIGSNCIIGPNCFIRSSTSIADNCRIGNAVEVKNSIIMDNTGIAHLSYFGDSVLGANVNIGAGTIASNLRHDEKPVKSMVNGKLVDTGRKKFGAVLGDNVHTGIGTMIYPGRKIWPGKTTMPGETVKQDIE